MDGSDSEQLKRIPFHSKSLWKEIVGKVDSTFKSRLEWLDEQQYTEVISPQLAELVRVIIHQIVAEEITLKQSGLFKPEKSINQAHYRALGVPGLKFVLSQFEDLGYYRISKAAELIESQMGVPKHLIINEYREWIHPKEE